MPQTSFPRAPAFTVSVLAAGGILIGKLVFPEHPPVPLLAGLVIAAATSVAVALLAGRGALACLLTLPLCVLLGTAKLCVDRGSGAVIPFAGQAHPHSLIGIIRNAPSWHDRRCRFLMSVESVVDSARRTACGLVGLVTFAGSSHDSIAPRLRCGQRVMLFGTVDRCTDERNPGEFSPREYYEANGISFLVFVRGSGNVRVIDTSASFPSIDRLVSPVREYMVAAIERTVGGEEGEFLKGILVGDRSGMSPQLRQAFVNAGVAHVLAVSGTHVVVVLGVVYLILEILRFPRLVRNLLASLAAILYMVLTGNHPPVVRATIMALVFLLGGVVQERPNSYNALGISALIILGIDARQFFDVGFQLSFGAVLSLITLYPRLNSWISLMRDGGIWCKGVIWLSRVCAVSLAATLGTLPLTAVKFGQVSVVGVASNIAVVPAVGLGVILGIVSVIAGTFSPWLASVYAALNKVVLFLALEITKRAGDAPYAYLTTARFRPVDALPFYAGLFLLVNAGKPEAVRRWFIRLLVGMNIAVMVPRSAAEGSSRGRLRVTFVDVGQGDAAVVEFPDGSCMVVDAGPLQTDFDAGRRVVAPFLRRRGIGVIDRLCVSHAHNDHLGGVPSLLREFRVVRLMEGGWREASPLSDGVLRECNRCGVAVDTVRRGALIVGPADSRLYVLSPLAGPGVPEGPASDNEANTSVVVKLQYGEVSFLFTGDSERGDELAMVAAYGGFLHATVLKVGHHGSKTSTSEEFLADVNPVWGVISVGPHNRFGHPSPGIIRRLEASNVTVLRTDEEGAVMFESDGHVVSRVVWR